MAEYAPIKGTRLRIVKLDVCGVPVTGTSSLEVVTKGFVQVVNSPQYEDGEEFFERNADGDACVNQKDDPTLKRFQTTVDFCAVDPSIAGFVLSARLLGTGGSAITGTGFAMSEGVPTNRFSMEVWQRVAGSGACDASGLQRFIYHAWPNVGAVQMQDYTVENGRSTLSFQAETGPAALQWGNGPGTPTWLPAGDTLETDEHYAWNVTTTALPALKSAGTWT